MHVLLRAFADELARCGMRAACTSPGSRSTPLVLALTRTPGLESFSHVDERCAGFFALGHAKATGRPVALACTSGTAAAHYAPAVIEAHEARVPLIVLTADRPPELRETGAGQTIDQIKLFGAAAKWFFEVGDHEASPDRLRWIRTLACRAYWTAATGRPGPVHLNFPLREPLVPEGELPADASGRSDGRPFVTRMAPVAQLAPDALSGVAEIVAATARGVVVCGREERTPDLPAAVEAFGAAVGYPVLSDPLGGARRGPAAIAHYDALLRDEAFAAAQRPDLVLRVGDLPTSKPLRQWLRTLDATQVAIDPDGAWQDPDALVDLSLGLDPASTLSALATLGRRTPDAGWLEGWRAADAAAAQAIAATLGDALSEPRVAAELGAVLPPQAIVFVASSMPVRDVETFFARARRPATGALQPRRQRHRRARLDRLRRRRRAAGPGRPADRRRRSRPRHRRPAGRRPPPHPADHRGGRQRRRRDLRLPARGLADRRLRGARRHAHRPGPGEGGRPLRRPPRAGRERRGAPRRARGLRGHDDPPRPHRPRRERRAAPPRLGRRRGGARPVTYEEFLATLPEERRAEVEQLTALMSRATGEKPAMWGTSIVGFGRYHYRYASGREGEYCATGFSPRKPDRRSI